MFIKPEEKVMYRPPYSGGLGLHNVKIKAEAGLIRTFMETACIPGFRHSQYHRMLFQYHVLEDRSFPNPGILPFYNDEFFAMIRKVHNNSPLNVAKMTEGQWYGLLLEDHVTMEEVDGQGRNYVPCRVEAACPGNDWEVRWKRARLKGLGPKLTSFLFKVLHLILTTQERLSRTNPNTNAKCKAAGCPGVENEDLMHALINCPGNMGAGRVIMNQVQTFVPNMTDEMALRLQFEAEESLEMPIVWILAVSWINIWEIRQSGKRPQLYNIRSDLEAKISLLRESKRFTNDIIMIETILYNL